MQLIHNEQITKFSHIIGKFHGKFSTFMNVQILELHNWTHIWKSFIEFANELLFNIQIHSL
jgi:hypothetical protein